MLNRLLLVLFTLYVIPSVAQTGLTERITVRGVIKDSELNPVSYAHILSKSRNEGWVCDYDGKFRISVLPGDTLRISAVSFHHSILIIPETFEYRELSVVISMQKDTVNLKELIVHPWPSTLNQMKREFMEIEIEDPVANLNLHLFLPSPQEMRNLANPDGGITMPGPISILYNKFSKEARSKRTYAELMKKEKAGMRFNKTIVSRITGLKNDDEIKKFMEFCSLQIRFILESTDYELYAAIINCYDEYCLIFPSSSIPQE